MDETYYGKVIAKKEGLYTLYVFQVDSKYIMCTKLPNWSINIDIDDIGYFTIEEVTAGDKYFDPETNTEKVYQYSNVYLKNFIKENINKEHILV